MSNRTRGWAALVAAGALAMILSPFLPWVTATAGDAPDPAGEETADVAEERGVAPDPGTGPQEAAQTGWESPLPAWMAAAAGAAGLLAAGLMAGARVAAGARLGGAAAVVAAVTAWRGYRYAEDPDTLIFLRDDSLVVHRVGAGVWLLAAGAALALVVSLTAGWRAARR